VGETGDKVIAFGVDEHLCLVFEATEGLGMQDAIAVSLIGGPKLVMFLRFLAASAGGGFGCAGSQELALEPFSFFPYSAKKGGSVRRSALGSSS
jgi:hypothetical protein